MNRNLLSIRHSAAEMLVSFGIVAALLFTPAASDAGSIGPNRSLGNVHALASVSARGSVVSATVTRVGSDFQISWTTMGDVDTVKIEEGTTPQQIENLVGEVSGITIMTVTGLDPSQRHYFRIRGGSGDGVIAAERGVPQIGVLNFRDIGGYSTVPNNGDHAKRIRWGMFFRSAGPGAQSNLGFLTTLGVRTVIDVRAPVEITAAAPQWNADGVNVISSPIFDYGAGVIPDPVTPHLCNSSSRRMIWAAVAAIFVISVATQMNAQPGQSSRPFGDVQVLATVPASTGFPEGIAVRGNKIYVSGPARFGTAGDATPSRVFAYDVDSGALLRTYDIQGACVGARLSRLLVGRRRGTGAEDLVNYEP